jgi:hypothetical protein
MCNCGGGRALPGSKGGPGRGYAVRLASGRTVTYLTEKEALAAHQAAPGSAAPVPVRS